MKKSKWIPIYIHHFNTATYLILGRKYEDGFIKFKQSKITSYEYSINKDLTLHSTIQFTMLLNLEIK